MHTYESIRVGDSFSMNQVVTAESVQAFAEVVGGGDPAHVDQEHVRRPRAAPATVDGVLLLGLISKILGHDFPGRGSVAVGLSCRFMHPVPVDSEITIEVEISAKVEERRHVKVCVCAYRDGKKVLGGEGTVIPPSAGERPGGGNGRP